MTTTENQTHPQNPTPESQEKPAVEDSKVTILLEYDMATSTLMMRSKAPTIILQGVLTQALSMVTQNQVLQRIQAMADKSRIVGPNGDRAS